MAILTYPLPVQQPLDTQSTSDMGQNSCPYTLDFLQELLRRKIPGVADDLFHDYPEMFNLLDVSCAPLLIGVPGAVVDELVAEKGGDAAPVSQSRSSYHPGKS